MYENDLSVFSLGGNMPYYDCLSFLIFSLHHQDSYREYAAAFFLIALLSSVPLLVNLPATFVLLLRWRLKYSGYLVAAHCRSILLHILCTAAREYYVQHLIAAFAFFASSKKQRKIVNVYLIKQFPRPVSIFAFRSFRYLVHSSKFCLKILLVKVGMKPDEADVTQN